MGAPGPKIDDIVPQKMHFIWVGGPLPEQFAENIRAWKEKNPEYEVHLWIDTAASDYEKIPDVLKAAFDAVNGIGVVHNLDDKLDPKFLREKNDNDHYVKESRYFDRSSKNMDSYNQELTGESRNLAAASDILRLEILYRDGGIYIDTDLPPNQSLGVIHAPLGFVKSTNFSNDFLCATPGADLTDKFRDKITQRYLGATQTDLIEHRNKRPWHERTDTTLHWTGPDMIKLVLNEELEKMTGDQAKIDFMERFQTKDLETKFIEESSQTWRDKGPKDNKEANVYFKEELNYRLRNSLIDTIAQLAPDKNTQKQKALSQLIQVLFNTDETVPIDAIISEWKRKNPKLRSGTIDSLAKTAGKIHALLQSTEFTDEQINTMKAKFFPKMKYDHSDNGRKMISLEKGLTIPGVAIEVEKHARVQNPQIRQDDTRRRGFFIAAKNVSTSEPKVKPDVETTLAPKGKEHIEKPKFK